MWRICGCHTPRVMFVSQITHSCGKLHRINYQYFSWQSHVEFISLIQIASRYVPSLPINIAFAVILVLHLPVQLSGAMPLSFRGFTICRVYEYTNLKAGVRISIPRYSDSLCFQHVFGLATQANKVRVCTSVSNGYYIYPSILANETKANCYQPHRRLLCRISRLPV